MTGSAPLPTEIDGTRMIFVGGLHRSGTTPFSRVFGTHPEISGLVNTGVKEDEGQHLQDVYPPARVHGGAGRFALSSAAHLTEASPLVTPANARRLLDSWEPYWEDPKSLFLLEKSPPNIVMGRFLQGLFPGSALVVVVRHPVIVALSTVKWRRRWSRHWWNYTSVHDMVHNWAAAVRVLEVDRPHLKRLQVVRYEDLLARPGETAEKVRAFLGLKAPLPTFGLDASRSHEYEQRWREILGTRRGRRELASLDADFGDDIAGLGYDLESLHAHDL